MATEADQIFEVSGMTCGHCAQAVTRAVQAIDAKAEVVVDLALGKVTVLSHAERGDLAQAIEAEGYDVAS